MSVQLRPESTVTEPEVVEGLVCDTSVSEFDSRQSLLHKMIARLASAQGLVLPGSRENSCLPLIERLFAEDTQWLIPQGQVV